jgi:hypothetical protein
MATLEHDPALRLTAAGVVDSLSDLIVAVRRQTSTQ